MDDLNRDEILREIISQLGGEATEDLNRDELLILWLEVLQGA